MKLVKTPKERVAILTRKCYNVVSENNRTPVRIISNSSRRIYKTMKTKVLSLILAVLMLIPMMASCTTLEEDDKGAIIDMYLTTEVFDFDPQLTITDAAQLKYMRLMFEGLTRINEKGKWENALMKKYKVESDDGKTFSIIVDLKLTRWSDGRTVQASDFVYSWKRLLDPDQKHEAASLLYDIKNAKAAKMGDASIDDVGIAAVDTYTLRIEFESKIDLDNFFEKMAAISVVPLREDVITRYGETWARKTTSIITNGPFIPKNMAAGDSIRLERSSYYYLAADKEEALDKYVIPYRLWNTYSRGNAAEQLNALTSGAIFFDGEIPLDQRAAYKDQAVITDMMGTHTYMFNTLNPLFAKAEVRQALSLALDREAIANIVTYAKAADGFIPYKVYDAGSGSQFREVGGSVISTSADTAKAQSLLSAAGVNKGSFTIKVRNDDVDIAVAEYVKGEWNKLGFTVDVEVMGTKKNANECQDDLFQEAYKSGDFDVIAYDMMMLSPDAFSALAPFSAAYSGNGVDMNSETYDLYGNVSGYASEAYDALIDQANTTYDRAERAAILHQAETQLLADMPVCPLYFLQDAYLFSGELSGITTDYYGTHSFNKTKLNDYMTYKAATDTTAETVADTAAAQ